MRRTLQATAAVVLLAAAATPLAAQDRRPIVRAELFSEPNFQGDRREITTEVRDLTRLGFNDRAASIRVSGAWEFCDDSGFDDRCITLTRDDPDLRGSGMAQRISSARPAFNGVGGPARRSGLTLFEGVSGSGRALDLTGETASLNQLGFNDRARSLEAEGSWVVCEHDDFRGLCQRVQGRVNDLNALGLSGRISSAYKDDGRGGPGRDGDGGWRDDRDRFTPGGGDYGRGRALEGRTAAFFPTPTDRGQPLPACDQGAPGSYCAQRSADAFCIDQGFRRAEYFSQIGRRFPTLEDVLCVR